MNHYAVLGVPRDASALLLKQRFRELARGVHPDKLQATSGNGGKGSGSGVGGGAGSGSGGDDAFVRVRLAYDVLKEPETRAEHDAQLLRREMEGSQLYNTLDLDDMEYDEAAAAYVSPCQKCGDVLTISDADLEEGYDEVECPSCTLNVRIMYCEAGEDAGEEGTGEREAGTGGAERTGGGDGDGGGGGGAEECGRRTEGILEEAAADAAAAAAAAASSPAAAATAAPAAVRAASPAATVEKGYNKSGAVT